MNKNKGVVNTFLTEASKPDFNSIVALFTWRKIREVFGVDKRSLALFRVWLAITTLWDLADRARDLTDHYTDYGVLPRTLVLESIWNDNWTSVYMASGTVNATIALFCVNGVFALFMLIGYYTKTATVLSYIFLLGLQDRNVLIGHSGDLLHRMAMLFAILLPTADFFSVDAALRLRRRMRRGKSIQPQEKPGYMPHQLCNATTVGLLFQVLAMYYTAYYFKTEPHWNGGPGPESFSATWLALQLPFFRRPMGDLFLAMPKLCAFMTLAVHEWQLLGCYCFFVPVFSGPARMFGVLGYFAMHMGFATSLRLGQFGWITCSTILALIPAWLWDSVIFSKWVKTRERSGVKVHFKQDCGFCHLVACLVHTFLLFDEARIVPAQSRVEDSRMAIKRQNGDANFEEFYEDEETAVAVDMPGISKLVEHQNTYGWLMVEDSRHNAHYDWAAAYAICRASPLLFPVAWLVPAFERLGRRAILAMHQHRFHKQQVCSAYRNDFSFDAVPFYSHHPRGTRRTLKHVYTAISTWSVQAFSVFLVYVIITWNASHFGWWGLRTADAARPTVFALHLDQYWGMFAPKPPDSWWYYNIEATLDNGTKLELFDDGGYRYLQGKPHSWDKPDFFLSFKNHRWFKYFENGYNSHPARDGIRLNFGRWLCRRWNLEYPGEQRLYTFIVHLVTERANYEEMDGFNHIPTGSGKMWEHICYNDEPSFKRRPPPVAPAPARAQQASPKPFEKRRSPKELADSQLRAPESVTVPQMRAPPVEQQPPPQPPPAEPVVAKDESSRPAPVAEQPAAQPADAPPPAEAPPAHPSAEPQSAAESPRAAAEAKSDGADGLERRKAHESYDEAL
eukprot:TRINITY_DN7784_c0_g1_i1.p1 TRINITY_DN7784_c0_g1~~TRINITY_DN7784_c0_g1_i1.p1  ORF type:complete len:858 (-),score=261.35 TRINITY_DN7784_c0_g1_i1:84-2624(-)